MGERRRHGRWWVAIAACLCLWLGPMRARAATLPGTPLAVCLTRAAPGDRPGRLFTTPERFSCTGPQTAWGAGDFWARARALPPGAGEDQALDVRFASVWQRRITLWVRYSDDRVARIPLDQVGLTRHLRLGGLVVVRVPKRHRAVTGLLWQVEGAANLRGVINGAALASPSESGRVDLVLAAAYAGFAGLCIAMLVYNLALWAALRHRFQLAYCVMVAALLAYALSSSGALAWLWPTIANNDRLRFNYLALGIAAASALLFARSFFDGGVFAGRLGRATNVIAALPVLCGGAVALLAPWAIWWLDLVYSLSFVLLLGVVAPVLWRAGRRRSPYLALFAIAWGAPVMLAMLRTASSLRLVPTSLLLDHSTVFSMALEALLSSLAIAYRIRLLSQERDLAREQEVAARLLADIDPLTGLMNRRSFLREAIGRPGTQALLLADIDHFKAVNDTLGHDGGDEVLRTVARALRRAAPPGALVARIGGEEFALVLPHPAPHAPLRLLDEVRAERMPFDVTVTVSIGHCHGPLATEADWKRMYRLADSALFEAKAAGRDRARAAPALLAAA